MNDLYLAHHGIKGQRWGVRRYQNADGSYTNEGHRHYGFGYADGSKKPSFFQRRKMKKAATIEKRLDAFSSNRKRFMTARQKSSYNKAKQYWHDIAIGKEPTSKRGLFTRAMDKHRSKSLAARTASMASFNTTLNTGLHFAQKFVNVNYDTKYSEVLASSALETGTDMVLLELFNKAVGHY